MEILREIVRLRSYLPQDTDSLDDTDTTLNFMLNQYLEGLTSYAGLVWCDGNDRDSSPEPDDGYWKLEGGRYVNCSPSFDNKSGGSWDGNFEGLIETNQTSDQVSLRKPLEGGTLQDDSRDEDLTAGRWTSIERRTTKFRQKSFSNASDPTSHERNVAKNLSATFRLREPLQSNEKLAELISALRLPRAYRGPPSPPTPTPVCGKVRRRTALTTQLGSWSLRKTICSGSKAEVKVVKHVETGELVFLETSPDVKHAHMLAGRHENHSSSAN